MFRTRTSRSVACADTMRFITISTDYASAPINHSSNTTRLLVCETVDAGIENALFQWEEGNARLASFRGDASAQRLLRRAVNDVHAELRRRIGSAFSVAELVAFYREGTDWCLDIVFALQDEDGRHPDPTVATDAAFYLYMRGASDFAGGRVIGRDG